MKIQFRYFREFKKCKLSQNAIYVDMEMYIKYI